MTNTAVSHFDPTLTRLTPRRHPSGRPPPPPQQECVPVRESEKEKKLIKQKAKGELSMKNLMQALQKPKKDPKADFVNLVKKHYDPPTDPVYESEKVGKRTMDTYVKQSSSHDRLQDNLQRRRRNLECGFFSISSEPYKQMGTLVLEPDDLFLKVLQDALPTQFYSDYRKMTDGHISYKLHDKLTRKQTMAKHLLEKQLNSGRRLCEMKQRMREARTAGMDDIKALLQESDKRITACRAGQPYLQHVIKCQIEKEDTRKQREREENEKSDTMTLQRLSSHTLHHAISTVHDVPSGGRDSKLRDDVVDLNEDNTESTDAIADHRNTTLLKKARRKIQEFQQQLESLYMILCSLHNMRSKHLKNKSTLSLELVTGLRRNPFLAEKDGFGAGTLTRTGVLSRFGTNQSLDTIGSSRVDVPTATSVAGSSPSRQSQGSLNLYGIKSKVKGQASGSSQTSPAMNFPQDVQNSAKALLKRNTRHGFGMMKLIGEVTKNEAFKLENWDDLLHIKANGKVQKQLRRVPPWLQPITSSYTHLSRKIANQVREKEESHMHLYHSDNTVTNMQLDVMRTKEKLQKSAQNDLAKLEREKTVQYKYKLGAFEEMPCLLEQQKSNLKHEAKRATRAPELMEEETAEWYEKLRKKTRSLGALNDEEIGDLLAKLEPFVHEDIPAIVSVKEKLCLLTMSIPVFEICTPHMQHAIKYVLSEILDTDSDLLTQWLKYRNLYVI